MGIRNACAYRLDLQVTTLVERGGGGREGEGFWTLLTVRHCGENSPYPSEKFKTCYLIGYLFGYLLRSVELIKSQTVILSKIVLRGNLRSV